jgi:nucleoside-diphosphate-sugar epimerase
MDLRGATVVVTGGTGFLGFTAEVPLQQGVTSTLNWYVQAR